MEIKTYTDRVLSFFAVFAKGIRGREKHEMLMEGATQCFKFAEEVIESFTRFHEFEKEVAQAGEESHSVEEYERNLVGRREAVDRMSIDPKNTDEYRSFNQSIETLIAEAMSTPTDGEVPRITTIELKTPIHNKVCSHIYDVDEINSLIKDNKEIRCPVADCDNELFISSDDLVEDAEAKELILQMLQDPESGTDSTSPELIEKMCDYTDDFDNTSGLNGDHNDICCPVTDSDNKHLINSEHLAENAEVKESHLVENAKVDGNIQQIVQDTVSRINTTSPELIENVDSINDSNVTDINEDLTDNAEFEDIDLVEDPDANNNIHQIMLDSISKINNTTPELMESLVCNDHVYDLCSINGFYCAVTDFDKLFKNSDHSAENAEATETHLVENAEVNDNINNFMQGPVSRINITSPYDPWTKDLIKNPVCNKVCGHVYDLDSISSRINDKNKIRCAVTDCHNLLFISSDHLVENAGVKEKIQELIQDDEYPF